MRKLPKEGLFVGQNWRVVEQLVVAKEALESAFGDVLRQLGTDLSAQPWWSSGEWAYEKKRKTRAPWPWAVYITRRHWGLGSGNMVAIGLTDLTPDAIFGGDEDPSLFVWVDSQAQPALLRTLAEALRQGKRLRSGDTLAPDAGEHGHVVLRPVSKCTRETADSYLEEVRREAVPFTKHYAKVLTDLDGLIRKHLGSD
jgi:hypothetical protein